MSSARIILLRHGETTSNEAGLLDSRPPGAWLTPRGQEQAREAGRRLAQEGAELTAIYCSIAIRAGQTAMLLREEYEKARQLTSRSIPLNPLLGVHEVDMGDWEMHGEPAAFDLYNRTLWDWFGAKAGGRMPGGEDYQDVLNRYVPALEQLRSQHSTSTSLVVSHGAAIRIAAVHACGVDPEFAVANRLPNCKQIIIRPGDKPFGQWELEGWAV